MQPLILPVRRYGRLRLPASIPEHGCVKARCSLCCGDGFLRGGLGSQGVSDRLVQPLTIIHQRLPPAPLAAPLRLLGCRSCFGQPVAKGPNPADLVASSCVGSQLRFQAQPLHFLWRECLKGCMELPEIGMLAFGSLRHIGLPSAPAPPPGPLLPRSNSKLVLEMQLFDPRATAARLPCC